MKNASRMDHWTFLCHVWAEIGESYHNAVMRARRESYRQLDGRRFA